ncbi:MAG: hypothetical protein IJF23_02380 [Clostridia bacterium]|nr:hypothetical protein [Clostridia bacterium]
MKRILCLLLISIFAFSMISCAEEEEVFDRPLDGAYESDLTGMTFRWGSSWPQQLLPESGFSSAGDKTIKRVKDLKDKYGCDFTVEAWEDGSSKIIQTIAAGLPTIDILDSHSENGGIQCYKANLLYCLEDIPGINIEDEKWGTKAFLQYGRYDQRQYGFYQYAWEFPPELAGAMIFNNELLAVNGIANPHEYQEDGVWNWENFEKLLLEVQAASTADMQLHPWISLESTRGDIHSFMYTNGLKTVVTQNGRNTFGYDCPEGVEVLDFLNKLWDSDLYNSGSAGQFTFDENVGILSGETYYATHFYDSINSGTDYAPYGDFEYGLIGYPYGPNGSPEDTSAFVHKGRRLNWVLAYSENSMEDLGLVLDFMFEPLDDSGGWKDWVGQSIFYHDKDLENYLYFLENANYNYSVELNAVINKVQDTLVKAIQGKSTPTQVFSEIREQVQSEIDKNITWDIEENN